MANKSLRQRVIERDGTGCNHCGVVGADNLDHIIPRSKGGSNELGNLQLLCRSCNSQKGTGLPEVVDRNVRFANKVSQAGFTILPNVVLRNPSLTLPARCLYALLRSYAWQEDRCFPGQTGLAHLMCMSERSLREYVRELEAAKLVKTAKRGRGKTNLYILLEPSSNRQRTSDQANLEAVTGNVVPTQTGSVLPTEEDSVTKTQLLERLRNQNRNVLELDDGSWLIDGQPLDEIYWAKHIRIKA